MVFAACTATAHLTASQHTAEHCRALNCLSTAAAAGTENPPSTEVPCKDALPPEEPGHCMQY